LAPQTEFNNWPRSLDGGALPWGFNLKERKMNFKTSYLVCATVAATLIGGVPHAMAADADQPFADTGHNWEGFYAGVGLGAGGVGVDFDGIGGKDTFDITDKGASLSGIAGYNFVADGWLLGVEGSLASVGLDKSAALSGLGTVRAQSDWLGSVQLRGGYAFDNVLLYGTAGLAITDVQLSSSLGGKFDKNLTGLVLGVGGEFAISDSWTMRAEGLAYAFEDEAKLNGSKKKFDFGDAVVRVGLTHQF
jgi:outer membrane immunogenic protein